MNVGIVGQVADAERLAAWLERCAAGIDGKDTHQTNLFPAFPGLDEQTTFRCRLQVGGDLTRGLSKGRFRRINALRGRDAIAAAVDLFMHEAEVLIEKTRVDVVLIIRPASLDETDDDDEDDEARDKDAPCEEGEDIAKVGVNFRDVLKARAMRLGVPLQVIRPSTWDPKRAGKRADTRRQERRDLQGEATRAWNLFTALHYKVKGKPWQLPRSGELTTCFVGVSFFQTRAGDRMHTSVAQIFNERGDGVVVRGAQAAVAKDDRQPHLSRRDSCDLLAAALERYRDEHHTSPGRVVVHKSSRFSQDEFAGFQDAAESRDLDQLELIWIQRRDGALLFRMDGEQPPLRGTFLSLDEDRHLLYTRGSVSYYRTFPGMYVPHPIGILTKLNWNQTQMDGQLSITLRTADRVGEVLRHVSPDIAAAPRYAFYM